MNISIGDTLYDIVYDAMVDIEKTVKVFNKLIDFSKLKNY